jgi:peptide/nickel transport system substrate-binding protein
LHTGGKLRINRIAAAAAVVAAGALVLSGCSATPPADTDKVIEGSSLNVAWNQAFYGYNTNTSDANATANSNITYLTTQSFNYYDSTPKLIKNTKFGSYEKISDDPLTVKYTIADGVKWNDGTPVSAADMLLYWASNISKFNTVAPKTDDEGNVTNQDEIDKGVFFDSVNAGGPLDGIEQTPTISDDNKSLTIVYAKPYIDWEVNFGVGVPAHTTYDLAFPDQKLSGTDAAKKVVEAIQNDDTAVLGPLSKAWSHGYDFVDMPTDKNMYPSDGAYIISDLKKDEYITLTANKAYTWGPKPKYQKITIRFIPDALAEVQALQNGEVSIINPQSTADILTALKDVKDTTVKSSSDATYEHVDLTFNNKGPFDPKTYGGDAAKALAVRQAFLKTIPRQDIIDKLIKPLNPDATLDNSQTLLQGYYGYDKIVADNGSADYATVDVAGAKALLASAGVDTTKPIKVNFMYAKSNPRRQNEYQLIAASAKEAGFDVVDAGSDDWGSKLGDGTYDAVLFGWQSTSTAVTAGDVTFSTGAGNNLNGYSNTKVDDAYKELSSEFDKDKQVALLDTVEKQLWSDAYGVTIFQFPGVLAWSNSVDGVKTAPLSPQYFWNYWQWAPAKK